MKIKYVIILIMMSILLVSCNKNEEIKTESFKTWDEVVEIGKNQEVTILMWGGNEGINQYMDGYVSDALKNLYGITLNRVPMNAPEYLAKLLNEKKGNVTVGTADLLWINAENFKTAKDGGLLYGPFTELLPNLKQYYDADADDLKIDSGIAINGYEAIWGRAQLVFTYDSARSNAPLSYKALMEWVKENPGRFTYPKIPDDFSGVAFVRNAFYELTGERDLYQNDMSREAFEKLAEPVWDYFNEMAPYLWSEGESYPATQAQLDDLFKNGEVDMTMGFEIGKTAGLVASGVYNNSVKAFVFDTGTIGNSHYLAIPYNSPEKAAALLVMDYLESPEAQIEKMKPSIWGDMPALDVSKLSEDNLKALIALEKPEGTLSLEILTEKRNPEMKATYTEWIKELWLENISR